MNKLYMFKFQIAGSRFVMIIFLLKGVEKRRKTRFADGE